MGRDTIRKTLKHYGLTILGAALAAWICRSFFLEAYRISGNSMVPALLRGDHVLVWKAPWIFSNPIPARGDIILVIPPEDPEHPYLRRVIGLPGESIEARDGSYWINGTRAQRLEATTLLFHTTVVPAGSVLALPDHLAHSPDASSPTSTTELHAIRGKALWIWLSIAPASEVPLSKQKSRVFSRLRFERFFSKVGA